MRRLVSCARKGAWTMIASAIAMTDERSNFIKVDQRRAIYTRRQRSRVLECSADLAQWGRKWEEVVKQDGVGQLSQSSGQQLSIVFEHLYGYLYGYLYRGVV